MSAERAWAHAMDLKNQIEQSMEPMKRHYLLRRLSKAVTHSAHLVKLTAERCDARSSLEAEAYSAWMGGTLLLEKETDWEGALAQFLRARALLEELFKVGDFDQRATCRHFLDQVEPAVRFCEYQIGRKGGAAPDTAALLAAGVASGPGADLLSSKLAALASEAQAQRAASTSQIEWNGDTLPVRDERCRVAVHAAQELEVQLQAVLSSSSDIMEGVEAGGSDVDPCIEIYDRTINAYSEARAAVRAAAQLGHQGPDAEVQRQELAALGRALHGLELEHTIARNLALAAAPAVRFKRALRRQIGLDPSSKKAKDARGERPARPEDVARLYDTLVANATELNDLAGEVGGAAGESIMDDCAAKISHFQAARCLYAGHSYLAERQFAEAAALFERVVGRCAEASRKYDECSKPDLKSKAHLALLTEEAAAFRAVAIAELRAAKLRQATDAAKGVDSITINDEPNGKKRSREDNGFLAERLDEWEAFAGAGVPVARIARIPPNPPLVAVRPIVLDTALMCIEPPNVEHRVSKKQAGTGSAAQGGMVSRLFGWGT